MLLKKVHIQGFRSIEDMKIAFDGTGHRVLVGKNESGKSNILKALSLLSGNTGFERKDKKESHDKEACVDFYFYLEEDEIDRCRERFYAQVTVPPTTQLTAELTVEEFFEKYSQYIFYKSPLEGAGNWTFYPLAKNIKLAEKWYQINRAMLPELGGEFPVGSYFNSSTIKTLDIEKQKIINRLLSEKTTANIYDDLLQIVRKDVLPEEGYRFPVTYWRYSEEDHDLPELFSKDDFVENPNTCIPLKNMFRLAKIEEGKISKEITEAANNGENSLQNLLNRVSEATNLYIKDAWKEYQTVRIALLLSGNNIRIGIKDIEIEKQTNGDEVTREIKELNAFDFSKRSDGFRRFISFLLLMSVEDDKSTQNNSLILIDEPETSLHPSSAKDFRDKLIALGKDNLVVYATHSISMIDTENIENNLIVSKEGENTKIEPANDYDTSKNKVGRSELGYLEYIYQAIGYSIFEELKKRNILLEGYTDKKILRSFMQGDAWDDFGICYIGGASQIKFISSILDLGGREYFVLSDADEAAKFEKENMGDPKCWYTYKKLDSEAVTVEDFYEKEFFSKIVEQVIVAKEIITDEVFRPFIDGIPENNRMESIKNFLYRVALTKDLSEEEDQEIKDKIKEIKNEIKQQCVRQYDKDTDLKQDKIKAVLKKFLQEITKAK